jgi:hypothetical protein
MKKLLLFVLLVSCAPAEPTWYPIPPVPRDPYVSFCGDNFCDWESGEDYTWCEDCEPWELYCGDGICSGYENYFNCRQDCSLYPPRGNHNGTVKEPGYSDPIPIEEK